MNIHFIRGRTIKFELNTSDDKLENKLKISFNNGYSEEAKEAFCVNFYVDIKQEKDGLVISTHYLAEFETSEPISQEFKDSHFPIVNAPAIAFPFLRSSINSIIINAGFDSLILPTMNFQKLYNDSLNTKTPPTPSR